MYPCVYLTSCVYATFYVGGSIKLHFVCMSYSPVYDNRTNTPSLQKEMEGKGARHRGLSCQY